MRTRLVRATGLALVLSYLAVGMVEGQSRIGPIVGVNFATLGGDDVEEGDFTRRTGFLFGAFAQLAVSPNFAIQPQVVYTMKGAKEDGGDFEVKLNHIQVPLLAQIRFPGSGQVTPYLIVGPALGFKASCKLTDGTTEADCEDEVDVAGTDFSLIGGVGVEIGPNVSIAGRYDYGLSKVESGSDASKIYNRTITFTIGYGVRLNPMR